MKTLKLSDELALPLAAVTEKLAWLGRTGSGKSYGAMKLAELMLAAGAQVGVLDPVGVWRALRVPAKPGGESFEVVVLGGLSGDVPLEPTAGALIADLVCDRGLSFVLDVSQFIPSEQQRFAAAFAERFFHRKKSAPSAVHLFLEECQEFIPENPSGLEAITLGHFQRLWKLGRNFGIGGSLISQRPQEIAKKALNMSGTLFAFQMTGPQERKTIRAWVADHGIASDIESVLQKLKVGSPHVESPTFLQYSGVIRILPRVTADLSSTPEVGAASAARRALTPIDLEQLRTSMAETLERAKADDPKELKKQIAEKDKRIRELERATPAAASAGKAVERQVLTDADRALLADLAGKFDALAARLDQRVDLEPLHEMVMREIVNAHKIHDAVRADFLKILDGKRLQKIREKFAAVEVASASPVIRRNAPVFAGRDQKPQQNTRSAPKSESLRLDGQAVRSELGRCERALLTVLAQRNGSGTSRGQLAVLTGYSHTSSGFANALGRLRTLGYVNGMTITSAGHGALGEIEPLPVGRELASHWIGQLPRAEAMMLQALLAHPDGLDKDDLSRVTGYSATSSGFANAVGKLRTLELASKGWPVRASEELFS